MEQHYCSLVDKEQVEGKHEGSEQNGDVVEVTNLHIENTFTGV